MWDNTKNYYMYGGNGDDVFFNIYRDRGSEYVEIGDFGNGGDKISLYSDDGKYVFETDSSLFYITIKTRKSCTKKCDNFEDSVRISTRNGYEGDALSESKVKTWLDWANSDDKELVKRSKILLRE